MPCQKTWHIPWAYSALSLLNPYISRLRFFQPFLLAYTITAIDHGLPPFAGPVSTRGMHKRALHRAPADATGYHRPADAVQQSLPRSHGPRSCGAGSNCNPSANAPPRISSKSILQETMNGLCLLSDDLCRLTSRSCQNDLHGHGISDKVLRTVSVRKMFYQATLRNGRSYGEATV
jgi:hypothetical protein